MSADHTRPHQFPQRAPDEVLAWKCMACGEWVDEFGVGERTECPFDWRVTIRPAPSAERNEPA